MSNLLIFLIFMLSISLIGQFFIKKFGGYEDEDMCDDDDIDENDKEKYL